MLHERIEIRRMKVRVLVLAVAAAMTLPAVALAGPKTTAPSKKVLVSVVIYDKGLVIATYGMIPTNKFAHELVPVNIIPRGDYISFAVLNRGKKVHNFTIFGKTTPSIKPGGKAHLFLTAMSRGNFLYRSTLDEGKSFRGYLTVK
jgi:hypothetical protein